MAYNLETVLAEKFETIITRGITNTRMRDFYDVYILINTHAFDAKTFRLTLDKTAEKRGTTGQISTGTMLSLIHIYSFYFFIAKVNQEDLKCHG